jgi:plastocyanin
VKRYLLSLAAVLALALPMAAPAGTTATKLTGTTGPGFVITLKKAGKKVTKLPHGKYTITVTDKATIHDFKLSGPGVNKTITSVPFKGTKTVTVTLKKGTYTYVCTPHKSFMKGSFKVT